MAGLIAPKEPSDDVRRTSQRQPQGGGPILDDCIVTRRSLYARIVRSSHSPRIGSVAVGLWTNDRLCTYAPCPGLLSMVASLS